MEIESRHSRLALRRMELWVDAYLVRPEWWLAEALAWIAFRDGRKAAEVLQFGQSDFHIDHPTVVAAVIEMSAAEDQEAAEIAPLDALRVRLIEGKVSAACDYRDGSNGKRPVPISAADWQYLAFRAEGLAGLTFVKDERFLPGDYRERFWNVRFDRLSVMDAFPAKSVRIFAHHTSAKATRAEKALRDQAAAWKSGRGEMPIRAHWQPKTELSTRQAAEVWGRVKEDYPGLGTPGRRSAITKRGKNPAP